MPRLNDVLFRIRTLLGLNRAEREMDEEFAFHLRMERDKLMASGMPADDAEREATKRFGALTRERQRARDEWGVGLVRDLASDIRHALRQFRRRPGYSVLTTATLALGIGATVSLFSVVRGTLLRPLPVADEARVHVFWQDWNWRGVEFDYLRERTRAFTGLAAYTMNGYTLTTADGNVPVLSSDVSANVFDVIGRRALRGSTFEPGDDRPGAEPKLVLSWRLWQSAFGGDTGIVGRRVAIGGAPMTVIGVMPRDFYFPTPEVEMWRTLDLDPASQVYQGNGWLVLVARASAQAGPAEVQAEVESMAAALGERFTYPDAWDKTRDARTTPIRDYTLGNVKPALLLLLGAAVLLLVMACANTAALVLSRTADRTTELTLRSALGAGRGRLVRQIIAESLVTSAIAGSVGAALAVATHGMLVRSLPLRSGFETTLPVDWSMFGTAMAIAAVVGLLVAAVPARHVLLGELHGVSGERSGPALRRGHRAFHSAMVTTEICIGVLLASGALLFVRSVTALYSQDPGFDAPGLVTLRLVTPPTEMEPPVRAQFYRDVVGTVEAIPGVTGVGLVSRMPIQDGGGQGTISSAARPDLFGVTAPNSYFRYVTPGYFDAMGISIIRGRAFDDTDRDGSLPVVIVSDAFARRLWPGEEPLGQQVAFGATGQNPWMTVVGVTEEVRLFRMIGENPLGMYIPAEQRGQAPTGYSLVARTNGTPEATLAAAQSAVRALDRRVAIATPTTMEDIVARSVGDQLQLRFFLSLFAGLALILGAVGVYGVASYAVSRRRAEFGVRMALGATSGRVLGDVLRGGVAPVVLGAALGVALAMPLSRVVRGFLVDVQPTDAVSLGGAAAVLLAAGLLAVLLPAMRAGRTNPIDMLRSE